MRKVIAKLDKIAGYLETFEEPWAIKLAYQIDSICDEIQEELRVKEGSPLNEISQSVLNQYKEKLAHLSEYEPILKKMIDDEKQKNASEVYSALKKHFGKLNRDEAIEFIKKALKE